MAQKLLQIRMDSALSSAWDTLKSSPNMERDSQAGVLYRLIEYYNERANHEYVKPVAPKPTLQPKPTAEQRKLDERKLDERKARIAEYNAEKLALYRATGKWPRVEMTSTAIPGWKAEVIVQEDGSVHFVDTERTAEGGMRTMNWTPPEDYPHMAEYKAALKHAEIVMAERSGEPVDPNAPRQADFVDDEGMPDFDAFQAAETKYQQAQLREGWGID